MPADKVSDGGKRIIIKTTSVCSSVYNNFYKRPGSDNDLNVEILENSLGDIFTFAKMNETALGHYIKITATKGIIASLKIESYITVNDPSSGTASYITMYEGIANASNVYSPIMNTNQSMILYQMELNRKEGMAQNSTIVSKESLNDTFIIKRGAIAFFSIGSSIRTNAQVGGYSASNPQQGGLSGTPPESIITEIITITEL